MTTREIHCCGCAKTVVARLTDGSEIYTNRPDLASLPFWRCDGCQNYVGCHHKTDKPTTPLGCIPTQEIKNARQYIHRILDPIWKGGHLSRKFLYRRVAEAIGQENYHTADIRSVEEARKVYRAVLKIKHEMSEGL